MFAHGAAGASAAAGSALLTDVLAALRWAKIQTAAVAVVALIAAGVVLPSVPRYLAKRRNFIRRRHQFVRSGAPAGKDKAGKPVRRSDGERRRAIAHAAGDCA